jgi:hypothetical protein
MLARTRAIPALLQNCERASQTLALVEPIKNQDFLSAQRRIWSSIVLIWSHLMGEEFNLKLKVRVPGGLAFSQAKLCDRSINPKRELS